MAKIRLEEMTGHQYSEAKFDKVILAVGSCENHGPHLPYGTDALVSYDLATEAARKVEGLLVLPPIYYGNSEHYRDFPLTISLRPETLVEELLDILISLWRQQMEHVVIINGHDGNSSPIEIATRSVKVAHPEMKIVVLDSWWVTATKLLPPGTFEVYEGLGHGGEAETSIAMAMFPDFVQIEHAKGVVPDLPPNLDIKWKFSELTDVGATGDPTKATRRKGDMMKEVLVNAIVKFIQDLDANNWEYGLKKGQ